MPDFISYDSGRHASRCSDIWTEIHKPRRCKSMERETNQRPLLIFYGECGFCWEGVVSAVKLILPNGKMHSGAHAVFTALASIPDKRWLLWIYERIPGTRTICEGAYGGIAR